MSDKVTDAIAEREKAKAKKAKPKVEKKSESKAYDVHLGSGFVGTPRPAETDVARVQHLLDTYVIGPAGKETFPA
jgi:hypothetical protein